MVKLMYREMVERYPYVAATIIGMQEREIARLHQNVHWYEMRERWHRNRKYGLLLNWQRENGYNVATIVIQLPGQRYRTLFLYFLRRWLPVLGFSRHEGAIIHWLFTDPDWMVAQLMGRRFSREGHDLSHSYRGLR